MADYYPPFDGSFDGHEHVKGGEECGCSKVCPACKKGIIHFFAGYGFAFYQCDECNRYYYSDLAITFYKPEDG